MIALASVSQILANAKDDIHRLHGEDVDDYDGQQTKKAHAAEVTRDLLALADSLDLAAALVRNQYWRVKGYPTVLEGEIA